MRMWIKLVLAVVVVFCAGVIAEETALKPVVIAPAQSGWQVLFWMDWMLQVMGVILMAVLSWTMIWIKKKADGNTAKEEVVEALRVGIFTTYQTLYKDYKARTVDGKLTENEKRALRENAIQVAKAQLQGPSLALLSSWSQDIVQSIVQRIVNHEKKVKKK